MPLVVTSFRKEQENIKITQQEDQVLNKHAMTFSSSSPVYLQGPSCARSRPRWCCCSGKNRIFPCLALPHKPQWQYRPWPGSLWTGTRTDGEQVKTGRPAALTSATLWEEWEKDEKWGKGKGVKSPVICLTFGFERVDDRRAWKY